MQALLEIIIIIIIYCLLVYISSVCLIALVIVSFVNKHTIVSSCLYYFHCKSNYFVHEKMYDCEVLYRPVHLGGQSYIQVVMIALQ